MAAHECFEALAVRELDVDHAAMTFHQREGIAGATALRSEVNGLLLCP
jgi:hypothetical protein